MGAHFHSPTVKNLVQCVTATEVRTRESGHRDECDSLTDTSPGSPLFGYRCKTPLDAAGDTDGGLTHTSPTTGSKGD